jgi:hypothetical protein
MRLFLNALFFTLCFAAAHAQPVPVKLRQMPNYFYIDKSITLKRGLNCIVISEKKMFERMFGKYDRPDTPNFAKEIVLVMLMPASKKESNLKFERVMMKAGDFVEVYSKVRLNHHTIPYMQNAIAVAALPRIPGVRRVMFYKDEELKLIETVEIDD